ncbi:MAG: PAS domain S-box protein [Cyanobacteria bacterium P01_H01_bin.58]
MCSQPTSSEPLAQSCQSLYQGLEQAMAACQALTMTNQAVGNPLEEILQQLEAAQGALEHYTATLDKPQQSDVDSAIAAATAITSTDYSTSEATQVLQIGTPFQQLFEASMDAMWWLENDMVIDCNQAAVRMLGYDSKTELLAMHPSVLSPEIQPDGKSSFAKANEMIAIALEQGSHRFEWVHQRANDETFWAEVLLTVIDNNGRQLIHTTWRDISERKRRNAEYKAVAAELREQSQLLRSTYEGVDNVVAIVDVLPDDDFRYMGWNLSAEKVTGVVSAAVAGKPPEEVLGAEAGTQARRRFQQCVKTGTAITFEEFLSFQGQERWWLTTLNPLKDEAENVYRIVVSTFDISARKSIEATLEQKEYQYRSIFESINDGIVIHDLSTGEVLSVNAATCKMHGYTYDEFVQLRPLDYIHPDYWPMFRQFMETIQAGQQFTTEAIDIHKDGTHVYVEVIGVPFEYDGKSCILAVVRDISERKRLDDDRKAAEAELHEQAQFLRSTYEGVDHNIVIIDVTPEGDFRFVDWNPATVTRTGVARSEIVGKTPEELLGNEQGTQVRQNYQRCLDADAPVTYEEYLPLAGRDHWWLTTLNPLRDRQGRIYRIVLTTFEISDRKATEAALQQQEYQYRSIFESINDGIFIQDINTCEIITVNPSICKMHGYTYDEFIQLSPSDYIHPESLPIFARFVKTLQAGQRFTAETVDLRKDGTPIDIEVTSIPFDYNDRSCSLSVVRDISDRKRLEAEQQQVENDLRDANSFLTSVLEAVPGFFFAKDRDSKFITVNSNLADFFGQSISEVMGKTDFDFFPSEIAQAMVENDHEVMTKGEIERFEEAVTISPSETATYLSTKAPLRNAEGDVVGTIGLAQDISDRKAMEVSLRESEQRFRDVTKAAGEYIWEITPDGIYTFVTEQAKVVKGYEPEELLGHTPFEFMCPDDIPRVSAIVEAAAKSKSVFQLEHRNVLPSGEVAWETVSGIPIFDVSGAITGFRGTGLSITDRKLAEIKIAASEAKFRQLVEDADDLIYAVDADGAFKYLSPQFSNWGYDFEDFLGQSFVPLVHPDDLPRVLASNQQLFATGQRQAGLEFRVLHRDGNWIWVTCNNSPVKNAEGQVTGFQGIARDISDRKAFEEAQSRLTAILEATSDFVGISNMDGEQLYMNSAGHQMLEIPASLDIVGRPLDIHLSEWAKTVVLEQGIPAAIRHGVWQGETALITYTGREFPVSQVIIAHKGTDGEVENLSTIIRDITTQKQAQAAFQQKAEELEQTLEELQQTQLQMIQSEKMSSLGQLVAGIAHEINNPVNFIHGNIAPLTEYTQDLIDLIELYQTAYPTPSVDIQERIEDIDLEFLKKDSPKILTSIQVGTERICQIVGSLKNFSRLDEAECKEADIHEGLDSTLLILEHRIKATSERPRIEVEKDYDDLPLVKCYPGQLNQVFMNILANALDALAERDQDRPSEAIKQNPSTIKIQTQRIGANRVAICIADNGPGIPEAIRQQIFNPFFTTKPIGKGTGIGMSISHQIITEKHGGTLCCQSSAGEGAQFIIEIPCEQN